MAGPAMIPRQVVVTPGSVYLVWEGGSFRYTPTGGVVADVEYTVTRTDLGGAPLVGRVRKGGNGFGYYEDAQVTKASEQAYTFANLPVGPVGFLHRAKLDDPLRSYVYTIKARYIHIESVPLAGTPFTTARQVEDGCGITEFSVTPPRIQTPVLSNASTARGGVAIDWKMPSDQQQTGFLVLGAGLPTDGKTVPCCSVQLGDLPAGSQSWLIAPFWDTPEGRVINASTGLRVTQTIAPWTSTPGPAPAGIKALAFPDSNPITNSCSVRIDVNWAPVPGTTGYTVYNDGAAISPRIPLTTLSFFYKQGGLRLSDLVQGALLSALGSDYTNGPRFKRGVNITVISSFGDRPDGVSAVVPYTFSTYPCWDGLGDR